MKVKIKSRINIKFSLILVTLILTVFAKGIYAEGKQEGSVTFIDVGQGDAIFIESGEWQVLIDAGPSKDAKAVLACLKEHQVKKLDVFIGTHPHADHIGGAAEVLKKVGADKIYMPKVSTNTKTFEKLLQTIKEQNLKITAPKPGTLIIDEPSLTLEVLAPNSSQYKEINEYSIVTKLTIGQNTFLFTGDAEAISEKEMLKSGEKLKVDVLKIGHHGGKTSTGTAFLKKVAPTYGVICVGEDNDYNHPNPETLERLDKIKVLRTDKNGNITFTTDGTKLTVKTDK